MSCSAFFLPLILKAALSPCIDKEVTHNRDTEPLASQTPFVIIRGNDFANPKQSLKSAQAVHREDGRIIQQDIHPLRRALQTTLLD